MVPDDSTLSIGCDLHISGILLSLEVVNAEKVTASVSRSEASDMAKEIFDSWVKLVRKSIP
jgi:hypothetical protein